MPQLAFLLQLHGGSLNSTQRQANGLRDFGQGQLRLLLQQQQYTPRDFELFSGVSTSVSTRVLLDLPPD